MFVLSTPEVIQLSQTKSNDHWSGTATRSAKRCTPTNFASILKRNRSLYSRSGKINSPYLASATSSNTVVYSTLPFIMPHTFIGRPGYNAFVSHRGGSVDKALECWAKGCGFTPGHGGCFFWWRWKSKMPVGWAFAVPWDAKVIKINPEASTRSTS